MTVTGKRLFFSSPRAYRSPLLQELEDSTTRTSAQVHEFAMMGGDGTSATPLPTLPSQNTIAAVEDAAQSQVAAAAAETSTMTNDGTSSGFSGWALQLQRMVGVPLRALYEHVFLLPLYFPKVSLVRGMYLLIVLRILFMATSWFIYVFVSGKRAKFAFDVIQMWVVMLGLQCMVLQTYPVLPKPPPPPPPTSAKS